MSCAGCYSKVLHANNKDAITVKVFRQILLEAVQLGISVVLLAGGEPLLRKDLLKEAVNYPSIFFPVFTNGLLINKEWIQFFQKYKHI